MFKNLLSFERRRVELSMMMDADRTETLRYENFVPPSPSCRERSLGLWTDQYCRKRKSLSKKMLACANLIVCRASRFSSLILERNQGESSSYSIETFPDLFHNIMTRLFQILFLFSVLTGATAADRRRHGRGLIEEKKEDYLPDFIYLKNNVFGA